MKVNNLLKKVGSVITTAALLATLGTTAFADAPEKYTDSNEGTGIKITDVRTEQVGTSDIYKVTVDYYTTVDNLTGMTMMMYTKNDINDPSSLAKPGYEASMKIVGIDQQAGKKGATGTAADDADKKGSFVFNITTNESGSNGYYVKKGVPALIAVSGDKCTPAYALCGVNAVADSATINVTEVTQDAPANATDEEIKSLLNKNNDVMNAKIDIRDANKALITQAGVSDATASGWEKQTDGTFKNTYTFAQGCKTVSGADFQKAISVSIVATITKTAVDATAVDTFNGKSAENDKFIIEVQKSDLDSQTGDKGEYLRNQILNKKVKFKAEEPGKTTLYGEISINDTEDPKMVSEKQAYVEGTNTYDYTVTVPEGQITDSYVIVPKALKTFTVSVSVTEKPAITAITPTSEINDSDYSFAVSDTEAFTAENIAAKLKDDRAGDLTAVKYTVGTEQKDATLKDFVYGWDVTVTGDTAVAKLKITGIKTEAISNLYSLNLTDNVLATVKVTKQEGVPVYLGDINLDGKVDAIDYGILKDHVTEVNPSNDLKDSNNIKFKAANIYEDAEINALDYGTMKDHITEVKLNEKIGKTEVGKVKEYAK